MEGADQRASTDGGGDLRPPSIHPDAGTRRLVGHQPPAAGGSNNNSVFLSSSSHPSGQRLRDRRLIVTETVAGIVWRKVLVLLEPPPGPSSRKKTGRLQRRLRLHQGHMVSPQPAGSVCGRPVLCGRPLLCGCPLLCGRPVLCGRLVPAAGELLDCWSEPGSDVPTSPNLRTDRRRSHPWTSGGLLDI